MEVFNSRRKMGGEEFSLKYREKLEVEIMEAFDNFRILNENKNIFKAANTPITLATVAMICYIASQILGKMKLLPKISPSIRFRKLYLWVICGFVVELMTKFAFSDGLLNSLSTIRLTTV